MTAELDPNRHSIGNIRRHLQQHYWLLYLLE